MPSRNLYLIVVVVAMLVLSSMGYMQYLGNRLITHHAPLVDAAMEIKQEATSAHLWFEEMISGDSSISIDKVWGHLVQADWYARAMLEGGENFEGRFYPLANPVARQSIESVRHELVTFREVAEERFKASNNARPGSDIDQRFDNIFSRLMVRADEVETTIQQIIEEERYHYNLVGISLLVASSLISMILIGFLYIRELSRNRILDSLNHSKHKLESNEEFLEKEVQQRTSDLRKVRDLLAAQKTAMDKHSIIAMTDVKGNITYVNGKFCEISGYTEKELIGNNHRILNSGNQSKSYWKNMYQTVGRGGVWQDEILNRAKDGRFYWVDTTIVPIIGENNKPVSYIAIRTDITLLKEMQIQLQNHSNRLEETVRERTAELEIAMEEAQQANQEKSRFLANMSHELRTPMHAILSFAELARKHVDDDKAIRFLDNIRASGSRLTRLINNLLDLSKLEAGKMTLKVEEHNMLSLVNNVISELGSLAADKDLQVSVGANDSVIGQFDEILMGQVLINLLSNAMKYSPPDGKIEIQLCNEERMLRGKMQSVIKCCIKDEGIGIPVTELDTVFDKFSQSSTTDNNAGGTGLGLPICKEIIGLHKGVIWAQPRSLKETPVDAVEKGVEFCFIIPRHQ